MSLSRLASAAASVMVELIAALLSASEPVSDFTSPTMPLTLAGSTALTSLSTSSDSPCSRSDSGPIFLPRSATPASAELTPAALSLSAFENASMLRTASPTAALLSATSLSMRPSVVSALAESDLHRLQDVLHLGRFADDDRRLAVFRNQRRRVGRAAGQRDRRAAGQPLNLEARLGVLVDRHAPRHLDQHLDAARIVGDEVDLGDLADANAVELHRAAARQAGDRAVEQDGVGLVVGGAGQAGEPQDEQERPGDDRQGEGADEDEIRARLHLDYRLRPPTAGRRCPLEAVRPPGPRLA